MKMKYTFFLSVFFHSYIYTKQVEVFIFKFKGDLAWGVAPSKSAIFCQYLEIIMLSTTLKFVQDYWKLKYILLGAHFCWMCSNSSFSVSICPSVCLSVCPSVCPSSCLSKNYLDYDFHWWYHYTLSILKVI